MSADATPKAGPLEALLLAIELAKRGATPLTINNDDGTAAYLISSRDWLGILECAENISTRIMLASGENPTRYVVDED